MLGLPSRVPLRVLFKGLGFIGFRVLGFGAAFKGSFEGERSLRAWGLYSLGFRMLSFLGQVAKCRAKVRVYGAWTFCWLWGLGPFRV